MTERRSPTAHNEIVSFWCDLYQERLGTKYPFNGGKDGATVKWLRGMYSNDEIKEFMAAFFDIEDDFIEQSGRSLGVFRGCLPKVIQFVKKGQTAKKAPANLQGIESWMRKRAAGE